ncbi:MAG: nucleotide pyrophosphohydrolase [Spirochaetes bacterium]|nr:nucleotide pyrophosphohydrolase [Spirochaetota bacterium]
MEEIERLTRAALKFRDERDWARFHTPKDLAANLSIEAGELQECFLWKASEEADAERVGEELADVVVTALLLAHHYRFDLAALVEKKLAQNAAKYPVDRFKGKNLKWDDARAAGGT